MNRTGSAVLATVLVGFSLVATGCTGAGSGTSSPPPSPSPAATTPTPSGSAPSSPSSKAPSSKAPTQKAPTQKAPASKPRTADPVGAPSCDIGHLTIALTHVAPTAGTNNATTGTVQLTDDGTLPCTLRGYPSLALRAAGGSTVPASIVHTGAATTVHVDPGRFTTFRIVWPGRTACPAGQRSTVSHLVIGLSAGGPTKTVSAVPGDRSGSVAPCRGALQVGPFTAAQGQ